jgi:spore germination cell wall hydrolase CwlJ-like protein
MFRIFGLFGPILAVTLLTHLALPTQRLADAHTATITASLTAADLAFAAQPAELSDFIGRHVQIPYEGLSDQETCLAQAVYFEARSEPLEGQLAVAQVILNRVSDRRYPSTLCEVVFQNERLRHRCQFSFACDGRSDQPYDRRAWNIAQKMTVVAMDGEWQDLSLRATHYHAEYVSPYWQARMHQTIQYGRHKFYRDRGI